MFLAAQGFLIFSPQSSLLLMKPRKAKITVHWVLMLLAACTALAGKLLKQLLFVFVLLHLPYCTVCIPLSSISNSVLHATKAKSYHIEYAITYTCHKLSVNMSAVTIYIYQMKSNLFAQNTSHFNAASGKAVD